MILKMEIGIKTQCPYHLLFLRKPHGAKMLISELGAHIAKKAFKDYKSLPPHSVRIPEEPLSYNAHYLPERCKENRRWCAR